MQKSLKDGDHSDEAEAKGSASWQLVDLSLPGELLNECPILTLTVMQPARTITEDTGSSSQPRHLQRPILLGRAMRRVSAFGEAAGSEEMFLALELSLPCWLVFFSALAQGPPCEALWLSLVEILSQLLNTGIHTCLGLTICDACSTCVCHGSHLGVGEWGIMVLRKPSDVSLKEKRGWLCSHLTKACTAGSLCGLCLDLAHEASG